MIRYAIVFSLLLLPALAQASTEISDDYMQIIGDPDENAQERIQRSIALLTSRAEVEENRGNPQVAELLKRAAALLASAPPTREASQLAAEAVVSAESGRVEETLVLAESAAALSSDSAEEKDY